MAIRKRTVPSKDEARPKANQFIDVPIMALRDGELCGPTQLQTAFGTREAFAARVITEAGDQGRVMFFWQTVVLQLMAALKESGDATFITIHKDGREYVASVIEDDATLDTLEKAFYASRPADADPPAEGDEGESEPE
jgi:hypothetical protein